MKGLIKFILGVIFYCTSSYGQIDNFTLSVIPIDETCTANGSLSFSVSNTLPGSTIIYTIYKLPNITTPVAVTSISPFTGLTSGTYRIVATQSLGTESATKQQDVIINDDTADLTYSLTSVPEICGFDGVITVNILTGNAVGYEIISGPVLIPLQSSNVFPNLSAGTYVIRVHDSCNEAVVQTFQLLNKDTTLNLTLFSPTMYGCNLVNVGFNIGEPSLPNGIVKYPLQVTTQATSQTGIVTTSTGVISSGLNYSTQIPFYEQQPYNYTITIVDGCGDLYTLNGVVNGLNKEASYIIEPQDCEHKKLKLINVSSVTLISAPSSFTTNLPINYTSQIVASQLQIFDLTEGTYTFNVTDVCGEQQIMTLEIIINSSQNPYILLYNRTCTTSSLLIFDIQGLIMTSAPSTYNVILPHDYSSLINSANYAGFSNLPVGTYNFDTIDMCGEPKPLTVVIEPLSQMPSVSVLEGCPEGLGGIKISGQLSSITLVSAPSSYTEHSIPYDFSADVINNSTLVLGLLPPGNYTFSSTDFCNVPFVFTADVEGYQGNLYANHTPNCGSFNLNVVDETNSSQNSYWLQKFNLVNNTWVHPATNVIYPEGSMPTNNNSYALMGNAITYNLIFSGQFRVLKVQEVYQTGIENKVKCFSVVDEFEFTGQPKITDILSISCGNTFEVLVDAEGIGTLQFSITSKNGQPFLIQNGVSNYFANLEPAIYNFRVEDSCGNIVNSLFEIVNPNPISIAATELNCIGDDFLMTVPNFEFLEYHWWKDDNTSIILGTTNQLTIPNFNVINNGTYHLQVTYPNNPNSCLNQVLDYEINFNPVLPNAGVGQAVSYCGNQGIIDLFSLLGGSFDTDGVWTEVSSSGTLIENFWNSTSVTPATYQFKYKVEGNCNLISESLVTIIINSIPQTPVISVEPIICEASDLSLYASYVPNVSYFWNGPNAFTSSEQNPVISNVNQSNSGTYTVFTSQNGCVSEASSVEVNVGLLPEFSLNQECLEKEYVVSAIFTENSNNIYSWTGPSFFTSNQNPIIITKGETGIYTLMVTNSNGCSLTKSIDVIRTICEIPNVITPNNDGSNDSLDLTGFNVKKIEIYNRWGRLVYDKENYNNEWYGQNNNNETLPDSTYYYLIEIDNESIKTGWIFISKG